MNIVLSAQMRKEIPSTIDVYTYGDVYITPRDERLLCRHDLVYFAGVGVSLSGKDEEIVTWLQNYPAVWVYEGSPMLEKFYLKKVEDKALVKIENVYEYLVSLK